MEFSVPDTKLETPSLRSVLDPIGQVIDLPLPIWFFHTEFVDDR